MPKRGPVGRNHGRALAPLAGAMAALAVVASVLVLAAPASAVDHNIRIREVFAGATTGQTGARFVELQMATGGQNLVAGNRVLVYNAAGTIVGTFTFPANLPVGTAQSSILVATSPATTLFGVAPDLTMGAVIPPTGGQVCYDDVDLDSGNPPAIRDCVAWGNFTGASPSPTGNPFGPASGIPDGRSIVRDISAGNPALLEIADDTDDSAADFDSPFALPTPRNNAGAVTTTASNAAVDGETVLNVDAAPGVKNRITVVASGAFWRLTDLSAPIAAGSGCEQVFVNRIRCAQSGIGGIQINAGDLNDEITIADDGVEVGIDGGAGDDRLTARNGNDVLLGGLGRDILNGGFGADLLDGGENQDTVTYDNRTAGQPVIVDLDGEEADDGGAEDENEPGGTLRDTVASAEILKGGAGGDTLTGNDGPNKLFGNAGQDQLHGLGANDEIRAKDGGTVDTITCGAGPSDRLFADLGIDLFPTDGPDACEIVS